MTRYIFTIQTDVKPREHYRVNRARVWRVPARSGEPVAIGECAQAFLSDHRLVLEVLRTHKAIPARLLKDDSYPSAHILAAAGIHLHCIARD